MNVESPRKTFLNFRNNLLMLYKNLPEKDLKHVMHARFWLDYIAAAKFLLTGHYPTPVPCMRPEGVPRAKTVLRTGPP